MKKYVRNNFLFQIERDKGEKIKASLLDSEFYKLSKYINSVLDYTNTIERGNFVGKQGYENYLFKNTAQAVVLAPISEISLEYTFLNYQNSFFIFNGNSQNEVFNFSIPSLTNLVLKYKNNNFQFSKVEVDDFSTGTIDGQQKIIDNSIDFSKIQNWNSFFQNQQKFLYKPQSITNITIKNVDGLLSFIDRVEYLPLDRFINYPVGDCIVVDWKNYNINNKFCLRKRLEPYINGGLIAEDQEKYKKIMFGVGLLGDLSACPINTIAPQSITDINMGYGGFLDGWGIIENPFYETRVSCIYKTSMNGNVPVYKQHHYAQPISDLWFYFCKMFWGEKQITNRILNKGNFELFYNINSKLWFYRTTVPNIGYYVQALRITQKPTAGTYQIIHNYHIADGCFEPRHFADNSISLNSIAKRRGKIPLTKFNRDFLVTLGVAV
jgi:hypothetical protein